MGVKGGSECERETKREKKRGRDWGIWRRWVREREREVGRDRDRQDIKQERENYSTELLLLYHVLHLQFA